MEFKLYTRRVTQVKAAQWNGEDLPGVHKHLDGTYSYDCAGEYYLPIKVGDWIAISISDVPYVIPQAEFAALYVAE